jgi:hypothetical protein
VWRINGEEMAKKCYDRLRMARRPDIRSPEAKSESVMSADDLEKLRSSLSRLGISAVRQAYHTAYSRCRMVNDRVPGAHAIQELVQVWKELWARR